MQDCQRSCDIVEICERRAVGVQISDFWLSIKVDDVIESGNQPSKIVTRLFICTIKMKLLWDCCKIVFNFSHMLCPICEIVERLLQDCYKIVAGLLQTY